MAQGGEPRCDSACDLELSANGNGLGQVWVGEGPVVIPPRDLQKASHPVFARTPTLGGSSWVE